ncbi:hypothetical protein ACHAWF_009577 [Thalassiosira exigua]
MTSKRAPPPLPSAHVSLRIVAHLLLLKGGVRANPKSRPYVAYRTDPFDQEIVGDGRRVLEGGVEARGGDEGRIRKNGVSRRPPGAEEDPRCPLSFRLGFTHSAHSGSSSTASSRSRAASSEASPPRPTDGRGGAGAHAPPVIHPLHPDFDAGSGRQILLTTDYEVLEMWTPSSAIGTRGGDAVRPDGGRSDGAGGVAGGRSQEQLKEDEQFPLLFEGSSFYHTSPVVHDVEGDGIADAILGDYDGNLHLIGLDFERAPPGEEEGARRTRRRRYYRRVSIPRLYVRKGWYDVAINRTSEEREMANATAEGNHTKWEDFEPYHTYFASSNDDEWRGKRDQEALRGVSGDVLNMDVDSARSLSERRKKKNVPEPSEGDVKEEDGKGEAEGESEEEKEENNAHRRLQEVADEPDAEQGHEGGTEGAANEGALNDHADTAGYVDDYMFQEDPGLLVDDSMGAPPEDFDKELPNWGDDAIPDEGKEFGSEATDMGLDHGMDDYPMDDYDARYRRGYGDDIYQTAPEGWDSYEQYQEAQDKYYHDSNYLRLPPHLLSTCLLAELPRAYAGANAKAEERVDELVLCAVSYYFDEDECRDPSGGASGKSFGKHANAEGGDETEELRGRYVANAIVGYNLRWKYWSVQEVLDLSTDWSAPLGDIVNGGTAGINSDAHNGMGAWALATPVTVKLDGSDRNHIIVGTSMGLVYVLEAQWHGSKTGWPVQMRHPVQEKVLVEDVVGSLNLEVLVVDTGGDVACLNADGAVLWARNLLREEEIDSKGDTVRIVRGTSPMSMGDVDGTGKLGIVLLARVATTVQQHVNQPDKHEVSEYRLYAIDASTGDDLPHFPMALDGGLNVSHTAPMPQPLLIDLHEDQRHWLNQIHGLSDEDIQTIRAINAEASKRNFVNDPNKPRPHGGSGRGLHVVQPLGSTLHIIEGSTSCEQTVDVGDSIPAMVQADDVHGTGGLDLVITTSQGEILTLESDVVPYHPLNVWSAGVTRAPGSQNAQAHGFSSTQGIFVHPISRQFRDILGIYVPITFEIFDRRPMGEDESTRAYRVDIRAGMSVKRTIFSHEYNATGAYTERIQIPYGPGYYAFSVRLETANGIVYEDTFHIGWNVNYMGGLWLIVCLPLVLAAIPILLFKRKPNWEEDEDYGSGSRGGILGR